MKWLVWKEFRINWLILAITVFLMAVPYAIALYATLADRFEHDIFDVLEGGWMFNALASVMVMALLGGQSFASERADRSAEFLAYQPVTRGRHVLSKLVLPGSTLLLIFGVNSLLLLLAESIRGNHNISLSHAPTHLVGLAPFLAAALCAFGVAWALSAVQNSPTFAVMAGIIVPIAVVWLFMMIEWRGGFKITNLQRFVIYMVAYVTLSLIGFVGGTRYYLRRVEP